LIVDQALPSDGGARFFEIDAHQDLEFARQSRALGRETFDIFEGGARVVDRAGADDHDQPIVHPVHDPMQLAACVEHKLGNLFVGRELAHHMRGRGEFLDFPDSYVVGLVRHVALHRAVRSDDVDPGSAQSDYPA